MFLVAYTACALIFGAALFHPRVSLTVVDEDGNELPPVMAATHLVIAVALWPLTMITILTDGRRG